MEFFILVFWCLIIFLIGVACGKSKNNTNNKCKTVTPAPVERSDCHNDAETLNTENKKLKNECEELKNECEVLRKLFVEMNTHPIATKLLSVNDVHKATFSVKYGSGQISTETVDINSSRFKLLSNLNFSN